MGAFPPKDGFGEAVRPVRLLDEDGNPAAGQVQTIAGGYSALSLAASGPLCAVPCILVRLIVDDKGTSGTVKVWDNASAASGTAYGAPTKLEVDGSHIPYGVELANGCYLELGGSAKVTGIFKAL